MTPEELKLRCLELAIEQARRENAEAFTERVAEIQTWLYNRIIGEDAVKVSDTQAVTDKQRGRPRKHPV